MYESIKDEIVREMSDPHSPWTQAELFARLAFVEECENRDKFYRYLDHYDGPPLLDRLAS